MKKAFAALVLLAAAGLVASILLTQLHYKVEKSGFDEKSFCNVSEFIDCDTVVASRYSSVKTRFVTIPNSELGILYYLIILLGLFYIKWSSDRPDVQKGTASFLFISLIPANLYSVAMAYISIKLLGVLCVMCLSTYVVNFLLLVLFPPTMGVRYRDVPQFIGRYIRSVFGESREIRPRLWVHLALTFIVVGVGIVFFTGLNPVAHRPHVPVPRDLYLKAFHSLPTVDIDVTGRPYWGNPDAKVRIVEFSDFQCPFCRRAAFTLKPYLKSYKDDVVFYYLNYPLDSACNPAIQQGGHPVSCLTAKASVCAGKQGKFWDFHDQAFENQKRLSRSTLIEIASRMGLDGPSFETCLASNEAAETVEKDVKEGNKLRLEGTPSVFINGRFFRDWADPERMRLVIEAERAR